MSTCRAETSTCNCRCLLYTSWVTAIGDHPFYAMKSRKNAGSRNCLRRVFSAGQGVNLAGRPPLLCNPKVSGECRPHFFTPNVVERGDHTRVRVSVEPDPVAHWHASIEGLDDQQTEGTDGRNCAEAEWSRSSALQDQVQDVHRRHGQVRCANLQRIVDDSCRDGIYVARRNDWDGWLLGHGDGTLPAGACLTQRPI